MKRIEIEMKRKMPHVLIFPFPGQVHMIHILDLSFSQITLGSKYMHGLHGNSPNIYGACCSSCILFEPLEQKQTKQILMINSWNRINLQIRSAVYNLLQCGGDKSMW